MSYFRKIDAGQRPAVVPGETPPSPLPQGIRPRSRGKHQSDTRKPTSFCKSAGRPYFNGEGIVLTGGTTSRIKPDPPARSSRLYRSSPPWLVYRLGHPGSTSYSLFSKGNLSLYRWVHRGYNPRGYLVHVRFTLCQSWAGALSNLAGGTAGTVGSEPEDSASGVLELIVSATGLGRS